MTENEQLAKVFADMAKGCLEAANKWKAEIGTLKGADKMYSDLMTDAERNAIKAKTFAPHLYS